MTAPDLQIERMTALDQSTELRTAQGQATDPKTVLGRAAEAMTALVPLTDLKTALASQTGATRDRDPRAKESLAVEMGGMSAEARDREIGRAGKLFYLH